MAQANRDTGSRTNSTNAEPTRDAEAQAAELLRAIYRRVGTMLHPHHTAHEPGGKDEIKQPLGAHTDVLFTLPLTTGQVLKYDETAVKWVNGTGGGGTPHQVHFSVLLPATVIPPGPCNITGETLTITAVRFKSDGEISGTLSPGGSFDLAAGGETSLTDGLSISWADGTEMTLDVTNQGTDGSYLSIDVAAE